MDKNEHMHSENENAHSEKEVKKKRRHKDQMSVTIAGILIYSVVLILLVVFSYIGFKTGIKKLREKQAIAQEEKKAQEEAEQKALEEELAKVEEERESDEAKEESEDESSFESVFALIENVSDPGNAPVNSFTFERKCLNDDSGKIMDYEIYTNPETDEIMKVTTRENCGDLYEITDYYYDKGKINYISQYREDTDVPIDLSTDKVESRYYFAQDKMIRYIYSENDKAVEYSVDDFDLYSEGTIGQYQYMEEMMLETSRTVFTNANDLESEVIISGYAFDELSNPMSDPAKVELLDSNSRVVDETETNSDGFYSFNVKPDDSAEYHIQITGREDMIGTTVYGVKAPVGTKCFDVETVYLAYTSHDKVYPVQMFALDAETANTPVAGAEIRFRYGINAKEGDICLTGVLGDAGEIMPALRSGNYTAEITKEGYETCYVSFAVNENHSAVVAYPVKDVAEGCYKAVLSYEATPLDLDLRCFDTYGRNVSRSANDSVGITAAETIALTSIDTGTYTFYVSDYTDIAGLDMMSYRLSQSGARMYVYGENGLESVFSVPAGHAGIVWRAFEIRNKKVIPVNDYYAYIVDDSYFRNK